MQSRPLQRNYSLKPLYTGIVSLALFVLTTVLVRAGMTQSFDNRIALTINASLGPQISEIMYLASIYGREGVWIPVVIVMIVLGKQNTKLFGIELAILFILGIILGTLAQDSWFRERPYLQLPSSIIPRGPQDTDTSFPSGHAVIVSLGASLLFWKYWRSGRKAKTVSLVLALEAAIVCYSRIYNGAHFPSDVIAGIFLGVSITFIGDYLLERYFITYLRKLTSLASLITRALHIPQAL
jgi:membrane-associated phospholipid phosphatase